MQAQRYDRLEKNANVILEQPPCILYIFKYRAGLLKHKIISKECKNTEYKQ